MSPTVEGIAVPGPTPSPDWNPIAQEGTQLAAVEASPVVGHLTSLSSEAQGLPLWPPWSALPRVVSVVARMAHVASEPPKPDPKDLDAAASAWTAIAGQVEHAIGDVSGTARRTGEGTWQGATGDAYRASLTGLGKHLDTVSTAARGVAKDLDEASIAMTKARERHERARDRLHRHLTVEWNDLLPWEAQDHLGGVVAEVVDAADEICNSHRDAHAAISHASAHIASRLEGISLPATLSGGASAYDQVNASAGVPISVGNIPTGSLRGTAAARADAALSRMAPAQRAHARMLLQQAQGAERKDWLMAAIGSGLGGGGLDTYARHLASMGDAQLQTLDPTTQSGVFVQPHDVAGGASSLVMARMLNHPDYAMYVATGVDPTGAHPLSDMSPADRFHAESLAMHQHASQLAPQHGVASDGTAELSGGAGVHGSTYRTEVINPHDLDAAYSHAVSAVDAGHPVPIYAGEPAQALGGHAMLAVGHHGDDLTVYNPDDGGFHRLTREQFGQLGTADDSLGWARPHSMSLPDQSAPTRAASRLG